MPPAKPIKTVKKMTINSIISYCFGGMRWIVARGCAQGHTNNVICYNYQHGKGKQSRKYNNIDCYLVGLDKGDQII